MGIQERDERRESPGQPGHQGVLVSFVSPTSIFREESNESIIYLAKSHAIFITSLLPPSLAVGTTLPQRPLALVAGTEKKGAECVIDYSRNARSSGEFGKDHISAFISIGPFAGMWAYVGFLLRIDNIAICTSYYNRCKHGNNPLKSAAISVS